MWEIDIAKKEEEEEEEKKGRKEEMKERDRQTEGRIKNSCEKVKQT